MIRGYFAQTRGRRVPFVPCTVQFPSLGGSRIDVPLLIDTGADHTVLSPVDALLVGDVWTTVPAGPMIGGIGGRIQTRMAAAVLTLGTISVASLLTIPLPRPGVPAIPSILGRDILSRFALCMEERTGRVLLLEPEETDRLSLP